MNQIINKTFENKNIEIIKEGDKIYFWGNEIAKLLGYACPKSAVYRHVDKDEKRLASKVGSLEPPSVGVQKAYQINESGLYALIFGSELQSAKIFKKWVFNDILPSIRKTGSYKYPTHNQLSIFSEKDLHYAIVTEIRNRFPDLMMVVQGGELQDTSAKRISMWKKGYTGGQPDIMITNPHIKYNGLIIELKTPKGKGKISSKQEQIFKRYEQMNWKVIVDDDLVSTILKIYEYEKGVRELCPYCPKKFKSTATLFMHISGFHKTCFMWEEDFE